MSPRRAHAWLSPPDVQKNQKSPPFAELMLVCEWKIGVGVAEVNRIEVGS